MDLKILFQHSTNPMPHTSTAPLRMRFAVLSMLKAESAHNRQAYEQSFYGLNAIDGPVSRLQSLGFRASVSACLTAADGQETTDRGHRTTDKEQRTQIDGSRH